MCFSATASFTAAAVLTVVGAATIHKTKNKNALPLACISFLFAIQQFIEGWLWLSLGHAPQFTLPLTFGFLFFAFLFWPIFVPFAARSIEPSKVRRQIMTVMCYVGAAIGATLYIGFLRNPQAAVIINHCVFYKANEITHPMPLSYAYLIVTIAPGLLSSYRAFKVFSMLALVTAAVAWIVYTKDFTSVWCFYAALVSVVLYFYADKKWY